MPLRLGYPWQGHGGQAVFDGNGVGSTFYKLRKIITFQVTYQTCATSISNADLRESLSLSLNCRDKKWKVILKVILELPEDWKLGLTIQYRILLILFLCLDLFHLIHLTLHLKKGKKYYYIENSNTLFYSCILFICSGSLWQQNAPTFSWNAHLNWTYLSSRSSNEWVMDKCQKTMLKRPI